MIFRRLARRRREMRIAPAAFAALCRQKALRNIREIMQQVAACCVKYLRADRHLYDHVIAVSAVTIRPFTVAAALGAVLGIVPKVQQRIETLVRFKPYIAALAAVTARRPAARNKFLTAKRCDAVSAIAGLNADLCAVDKHL